MKRPSFQFYPSDWLRDTGLRSCSTGARGLWIDMICFMHEGTPYGHLKVGEKVILPVNLARMVGETLEQVEGWLEELKQAGVFDVEPDGTMVSRRMVRDEEVRSARASGGKLGGNPLLLSKKVNLEVKQEVAVEDKQIPTPSSSSSSSLDLEPNGSMSGTSFHYCPQKQILALWKAKLPHLTQPRIWEGSRAAALRQRWYQASKPSAFNKDGYDTTEGGLEWWESFFDYIANDTKLSNGFESQGRVWKPDLEWVVNATNFQKIIDGKYDK